MKAYRHHTVSRAWCYDHYVSKLTLCDLGLYHMYTSNVIVLHILIDFSHDDPAQILRATTTPDF